MFGSLRKRRREQIRVDTTAALQSVETLQGLLKDMTAKTWTVRVPVRRSLRQRIRSAWIAFIR